MIRIIALIFVVFSIVSCQQRQDNIVLTDFTKELISLYIDTHIDEIEWYRQTDNGNNPLIIIATHTDTLNYFLFVRFDTHHFDTWRFSCFIFEENFLGKTSYRGFEVRVFGEKESVFYSGAKSIKPIKGGYSCVEGFVPPAWVFVLHNDLSFCKMRTSKVRADEDISDIQRLAERHFKVSNCMPEMHENEVFSFWDVDSPPKFVLGEDSFRSFMTSNLKIKSEHLQRRFTIWIDIAIDKDGEASLEGVGVQGLVGATNEQRNELWNDARRVAEKINQFEFIPAMHRGQIVNSAYTIFFRESDFVRKKTE